jgi:hypothetical protein
MDLGGAYLDSTVALFGSRGRTRIATGTGIGARAGRGTRTGTRTGTWTDTWTGTLVKIKTFFTVCRVCGAAVGGNFMPIGEVSKYLKFSNITYCVAMVLKSYTLTK